MFKQIKKIDMKKNKVNRYTLVVLALFLTLFVSCEEDVFNKPLTPVGDKPGVVTNCVVENKPGEATITYTLPNSKDLAYVEAVYILPGTGEENRIKSSAYNNNVTVVGFGDSSEQEVELYAVSKSEQRSEPVSVLVHPDRSPIWGVIETVDLVDGFGGFNLVASNESEADIAIEVMEKDQYGAWVANSDLSVYTSAADVKSSVRGLDTLTYNYAITVRDRYLNYTDTIFDTVHPLYETLIPKNKYSGVSMAGDAPHHASTSLAKLWDGDVMSWPSCYLTLPEYDDDYHSFCFDIGEQAKISRVKIWDYPEYYNGRMYYYMECMRKFEIWGRSEVPDVTDSSFDGWTLLAECEQEKPSGLPYGEQNDEDYSTANAGFDWECDVEAGKMRYIRIRCIENWMGTKYIGVAEVQVYGDPR